MNKLCNIGTMESYTAVKRNEELIRSDFYDILPKRRKLKCNRAEKKVPKMCFSIKTRRTLQKLSKSTFSELWKLT